MFTKTRPLSDVTLGLALSPIEGLSVGTAERVANHNRATATLVAAIAKLDSNVEAAVESVGLANGGLLDLTNALEGRRLAHLDFLESAAHQWRERGQLAALQRDELQPQIDSAATTLDKAMATAIGGLAKAGITADEMQAGGVNPAAAQQQLEAIAKQARPVRNAFAALTDANARAAAARQQVAASKQGEIVVRETTRATASKMAAALA